MNALWVIVLLICCAGVWLWAAEPDAGFETSAERKHVEVIASSRHAFAISMGGTLDMDNTMTRAVSGPSIALQHMDSVTIENTGEAAVVSPRIVANGRGNWYTFDDLVAEATRGAQDDQEKVYLIHQFMGRNHYHFASLFAGKFKPVMYDPVIFLNSYGCGLCGYSAHNGLSLAYHAGIGGDKGGKGISILGLHGHVVGEVFHDGDYQMMDMAAHVFYLDRENREPVSGQALARDHDLARRELRGGPEARMRWKAAERSASLFGHDDIRVAEPAVRGHAINIVLRPGEKLTWRWANGTKFAAESLDVPQPPLLGNALFEYEPNLDINRYRQAATDACDIVGATAPGARLAGASDRAFLTFHVAVPYVICGGTLRARFIGRERGDRFSMELSHDGKQWTEAWRAGGKGSHDAAVSLGRLLRVKEAPPKHDYHVRVALASASTRHALASGMPPSTSAWVSVVSCVQ